MGFLPDYCKEPDEDAFGGGRAARRDSLGEGKEERAREQEEVFSDVVEGGGDPDEAERP